MISLRYPMTLRECWAVIPWRNACRGLLRSTSPDTRWSQLWFWLRVIRNPWRRHRYYAVRQDGQFVGMVGLCHVQGQSAEISLITDPNRRGQGIGRQAVEALNQEARRLGLRRIWGEVYGWNDAVQFWQRLTLHYGGRWHSAVVTRGDEPVSAYRFEWMV